MYNEGAGGEGDGQHHQGQQQGQVDPDRVGFTNARIADELADMPFPEEVEGENQEMMMDDGGGIQKTPEEELDQKSPEEDVEKDPEDVGEAQNAPEDAPEAPMPQNPAPEVMDSDDEDPLAPTQLGTAIDSLMMHWCQLLTNVTVKAPVPPPPTLDHVKEVAEVCSKHFRDASVDVNNELTRLGIQWEMEESDEQCGIEDENLDEAIQRQETLIQQARDIIKNRVDTFNKECPNAGKQFNT